MALQKKQQQSKQLVFKQENSASPGLLKTVRIEFLPACYLCAQTLATATSILLQR